jgi:small-conductance mechanosensitive channel
MPSEVAFALRDLSDPSTLPGAASHAVVIGAIAWLAGRTVRLAVHRALEGPSPRADPTAVKFLAQLARLAIYVLALLSFFYEVPVLRQLGGVWLTSVGVVSVVVGIAAQSTLGNLISGVALLLYRPFCLGERLQVSAPSGLESGVVESLSLGYTTLKTDDDRRIVIPNSVMASQTSINITVKSQRAQCVVSVTIGYQADIDKARAILTELAQSHPKAVEVVSCRVSALSDSGTTLTLTAWCEDAATAGEVKSDLLEGAKKRFDGAGIAIAH